MLALCKRLALGVVLIVAAAALLLLSDLRSRVHPGTAAPPAADRTVRVALLQHASQLVLDQGVDGVVAGLRGRGWIEGRNLELKRYNSQGDMTVAQAMAKEMAGGGYDLLISISTVSTQAVARANAAGKTPQVFGLVSDPYGAGIGISRENHLDHPAHLAGYGTMQPVALAFRTAREMNPKLARVGVVWNAAESNSEAQMKIARATCKELGIELLEATVDSSAGVGEAASALVARGAQALWMAGDVTVLSAADAVVVAGQRGKVPVFTVIPPNVKKGALFDVGADYVAVGTIIGELAGDVLNGKQPADVAVDNVMPELLTLNEKALKGVGREWTFPKEIVGRAQLVVDAEGVEHARANNHQEIVALPGAGSAGEVAGAKAGSKAANPSRKTWHIAVVLYSETPPAEETLVGMAAAWKRSPLVAGKDYVITTYNAQGDMAAVGGIMDAALTAGADIVVPLSTPTLQSAVHRVKRIPVVFGLVSNPMVAGAGKSYTDHLPQVTGITVLAPFNEALDLIQKYFPQYRRLGTLFCPAEANSVELRRALEEACRQRGLQLESVAVNTSGELSDSALALVARPIDAVLQLSDNLSSAGFTAITRAARGSRKPLISLNSTAVSLGAPLAFGRDYADGGEALVGVLERVIGGESTADIPFKLPPKIVVAMSQANAAAVGMTLPPALLKEATH